MKVAIINFSGNVGKTTIARHLLLPRIKDAELISIESANALRGNLIVDIGASNVEDLITPYAQVQGQSRGFRLRPGPSDQRYITIKRHGQHTG